MQQDYLYGLKWLAMSFVRAIVPILLKFLAPSNPHPCEPSIKTSYVPTTDPRKRPLSLHIYFPSSYHSNSPLPIHINIHGSGFCLSNFGADAAFCAYIADSVPCIVVDADHRKAPEHPWPAGPDDVRDVVHHIRTKLALDHQDTARQPWDISRISIGGFSSGGCLALIESSRVREPSDGDQPLTAVISFYPSTDLAEPASQKPQLSPSKGAAGSSMPAFFRRFLYACYLPASIVPSSSRNDNQYTEHPSKGSSREEKQKLIRSDPRISPMYARPEDFPRSTTIITCERDSLAREGVALARKLQDAAVGGRLQIDVVHWEAPGQGHNWDHEAKEGTEPARLKWEAYALARDRLREAYDASAAASKRVKYDNDTSVPS